MNQQLASEKIRKKAAAISGVLGGLVFYVLSRFIEDGVIVFSLLAIISVMFSLISYKILEILMEKSRDGRKMNCLSRSLRLAQDVEAVFVYQWAR